MEVVGVVATGGWQGGGRSVIGTGGRTNDANIGNGDVPDVRLEAPGSVADPDTQYCWNLVRTTDGLYRLQAVKNPNPYLTGASAGAPLTLRTAMADGSQDWELVR